MVLPMNGAMLEHARGNLLSADVDALVNSVNTVGVMGKGLALQFKRAFPENFQEYARACKAGEVQVGRVFVHHTGQLQPKWILNVPTKRHWRQPSRLDDVRRGIEALARVIQERDIRSVAVPPLGCGAGGLAWSEVRPLVEAYLGAIEGVRVLVFEPGAPPPAESMPNRTSRPEMTQGRAALLALAASYLDAGLDDTLSTLEIHKLAYFMQAAGERLRLKFVKHHYGPYADALRNVLGLLEGHYISGLGDDATKPTAEVKLLPGSREAAKAFLAEKPATREHIEKVLHLIEGFEDPYGLELLATTHWVMREQEDLAGDPGGVAEAVRRWSDRKARTMKPSHITAAWERLRQADSAFGLRASSP